MSNIDERDFDIVDMTILTCDGKTITGVAMLCDLGGGLVPMNFTHVRKDAVAKIFPAQHTDVAAIEWMALFGMDDLTSDANEAMDEHRDWLQDKDTMCGPMAFVVRGS